MSKLRVFEDEDEYLKFCEDNEDRIILVYQDDVLDVTDFLDEHPGGGEILEDYNSQDITEVFHSTHRHVHSHRALKLMSKYKIGYFKDTEAEEHASVIVPDQKQQWTYPIVSQDKIEYREFKIDLRTGLASQVSKLGKRHYLHMLKSPVEIPFTYKVHNNDLLNQVSSSKGLIAGLFWGVFLLYKTISGDPQGSKISQEDSNGVWSFIFSSCFAMVFGVLIGSLLEYFLHRCFYFVEESLPENPTLLWLHFAIFGKHQISPSDTTKVNTPIWFQMVILFVVYSIFSWGFSWRFGILACFGVVFHFMISEHVHYKIHSKEELNENLKRIQQYHNNCHNRKGKSGYGLILKFWNKIFGTELAQ